MYSSYVQIFPFQQPRYLNLCLNEISNMKMSGQNRKISITVSNTLEGGPECKNNRVIKKI